MVKYKSRNVIEVDDWDDLVKETYKRPYNFQQQDDCKSRGVYTIIIPDDACDYENDTVPENVNDPKMGVSFKAWLERDPNQKLDTADEWDRENGLETWWERNFYPDVQMIANDLHAKGLVKAGEYDINVDW